MILKTHNGHKVYIYLEINLYLILDKMNLIIL